ncbi:N-acetyltransferase family protein [Bacillus timonensis]|nr:N-acetyltransferase family protein [Bacillus timonensis]
MITFNTRPATISDLDNMLAIYNEAILSTVATFDTVPRTQEEQLHWFKNHGPSHPILVTEQNGIVVGWISLSKWSDRQAYNQTVELSMYIHKDFRGQGAGKELMQQILKVAKRAHLHTIISRISDGNDASIHLHKQFGFNEIGTMKEVGKKFGRFIDVHIYQKMLTD